MRKTAIFILKILFVINVCCISSFNQCAAFGILTHEAIIDASWKNSILPLLKQKFPNASQQELELAKAYVYGGSVLPDIGYFPFGSIYFTNLFHHVRTGDFVESLFNESRELNEYAFAIGVLCHYLADIHGHSIATNRVVPMMFPKLQKKYGSEVTYEEAPASHTRVEFGFDVLQIVGGNYQPGTYHQFIGFKISEPVLERAFLKTYGQKLEDVFGNLKISIETFRFTVRSVIPEVTRDAWKVRKSAINKLNPLATEENYYYNMKGKEYKEEFGKKFRPQSLAISLLIGVVPKIGPLAVFKFKEPTEEGEKLYQKSFLEVVEQYNRALKNLGGGNAAFANLDLDSGHKVRFRESSLADETYEKWLKNLYRTDFETVDLAIQNNIKAFYKPADSKPDSEPLDGKAGKALAELNQFKGR